MICSRTATTRHLVNIGYMAIEFPHGRFAGVTYYTFEV